MSLDGKVAVVTGGTKGIGEAIADRLAEMGAKVVVCARQKSETRHRFVKADMCVSGDCKGMVEEAVREFGRVDILVNNAGIYPFKPFLEMTEDEWKEVLDVNLNGVFRCTKAAVPHMIKQGGGKIVNVASIAGIIGFPGLAHYCTTKAGLIGFTRTLALELAPKKINVNAVAPGAIRTPGTEGMLASGEEGFLKSIPWGRIGEPRDIANAVAFLCSDESDYVTGHTLVVDGGWTSR